MWVSYQENGPFLTFFPPQWYFLRFKAEFGYKYTYTGFPGGIVVKNLLANKGDTGLIPRSGRSPREGNGNPLQYSCLENPMDRGAWWATVHEITKTHITHARTHITLHTIIYKIKIKDLLYSTGNYIQYFVIYNRKESAKNIYRCITEPSEK